MKIVVHTKLRSITPVATKLHMMLWSFCSVNMDAWCYRFSVACDIMESQKGDVRMI
jgi:hypothetical protein